MEDPCQAVGDITRPDLFAAKRKLGRQQPEGVSLERRNGLCYIGVLVLSKYTQRPLNGAL